MKNENDILEGILDRIQKLRPIGFLLSHFSSDDKEGEALRSLGSNILEEVDLLEEIHHDIERIWKEKSS